MNFILVTSALIAVLTGCFVSGLTGFGQGIVFQVFWSFLNTAHIEGSDDLTTAVAVNNLMQIITTLQMAPGILKQGHWRREIAYGLLPGSLLMTSVGTWALVILDQDLLRRGLGLLFLCLSCWQLSTKLHSMYHDKKQQHARILTAEYDHSNNITSQQQSNQSHDQTSNQVVVIDHHDVVCESHDNDNDVPPQTLLSFQSSSDISYDYKDDLILIDWPLDFSAAPSPSVTPIPSLSPRHPPPPPALTLSLPACSAPVVTSQAAQQFMRVTSVQVDSQLTDNAQQQVDKHEVDDHNSSSPSQPHAYQSINQDPSSPSTSTSSFPPSSSIVIHIRSVADYTMNLFRNKLFLISLFVGMIVGFLAGAFGTGGPPTMLMFSMIVISKEDIRGTVMMLGLFAIPIKIISCIVFGVYRAEAWPLYVLTLPATLIGTAVGSHYHSRVNLNTVMLVLQALVLLSTVPLTSAGDGSVFGYCILTAYAIIIVSVSAFAIIMSYLDYRLTKQHPVLMTKYVMQQEQEQKDKRRKNTSQAVEQPHVASCNDTNSLPDQLNSSSTLISSLASTDSSVSLSSTPPTSHSPPPSLVEYQEHELSNQ